MTSRKGNTVSTWDGLEDEVLRTDTVQVGPRCSVGKFYIRLGGDLPKVQAVVENVDVSATVVERSLRSRTTEPVPSASSIRRHRKGDCYCGRQS